MNNIVAVQFDKLFQDSKSLSIKRTFSGNVTDSDFYEFSILKNNFGFAFPVLILSVNMKRPMFIGVEQNG